MAKLSKLQPVTTYIEDTEIVVNVAPAYVITSAFNSFQKIKDETAKNNKMLDVYYNLVLEYSDLENTKEELKEILSFDSLMTIIDIITGAEETASKANFTQK